MNLDFFKSKKNKIILCVLCVVVVIFIVIAVVSNTKDSGKLLLTCSVEKEMQNQMSANQTITLYKLDNGIRLNQNMKLYITGDLTKYSSSIYNKVAKNIEQEYEYLSGLNYVDYTVNYNADSVIFKFDYRITNETNEQVISGLGYDFLNNSVQDIKLYFEKGGLKCQES